ncbi:MAG TPA: hypothetical protein VFC44_10760 [Candidatus Saccharimonadales bacterium]|nr:hypothetical protein [Candidatus Saccharimonadales bacterium]
MKPKKPTKATDTETSSILSELEGELSPATLDALAQIESAYGIEKPAKKDDRTEIASAILPMEYPDIKTLSMLAAVASQGTTKTPSEARPRTTANERVCGGRFLHRVVFQIEPR